MLNRLNSFVSSLFKTTQPLTATERWKKYSAASPRDNSIKKIATNTLSSTSYATLFASAAVPTFVLSSITLGTLPAITSILCGVLGVSGSLKGLSLSSYMKRTFDWNDYSKPSTVMHDQNALMSLDLETLSNNKESPVYRLGNLKKYGAIGEETKTNIQNIFNRFVENKKTANELGYKFPEVTKMNSEGDPRVKQIQMAYRQARDQLFDIESEWRVFQEDKEGKVAADLPKIAKVKV